MDGQGAVSTPLIAPIDRHIRQHLSRVHRTGGVLPPRRRRLTVAVLPALKEGIPQAAAEVLSTRGRGGAVGMPGVVG